MNIFKKIAILPILLLLITSCNSNKPSSTSTSTSTSTSSILSTSSVNIRPNFELESATNILPYKEGDLISKDLSYSMTKYNVVSKALVNSNHEDTSWIYQIDGKINDVSYNSYSKTSYTYEGIDYQEATYLMSANNFGRIINAYYDGNNYIFGHSKNRSCDKDLTTTNLNVELSSLKRLDKEEVISNIGDFTRIEDLFPVNRYTVDESESKIVEDNGSYQITLYPQSYTFFSNFIIRYGLSVNSFIKNFDSFFDNLPNENFSATYKITNDYKVEEIEYKIYGNDKMNANIKVSFASISTLSNITSYKAASNESISSLENETLTKFQNSTATILRSIIYQLANSSQYKFPFSISYESNDTKTLDILGNVEFQTSWKLSDFTNIDLLDFDKLLGLVLKSVNFNIDIDIKYKDDTSNFITSYDCSTKLGQFTFTTSLGEKIIMNYNLSSITSFSDVYNYIIELYSTYSPSVGEEIKNIDWTSLIEKVLQYTPSTEGDIKFIDPFFLSDLLVENQYTEISNLTKIYGVIIDGKTNDYSNLYLDFLNTNDPNSFINNFIKAFNDLGYFAPILNTSIDFSSIKYSFNLLQNLSTSLLKVMSLEISFDDNAHHNVINIIIDEIKEMDSASEFILNKYVTEI